MRRRSIGILVFLLLIRAFLTSLKAFASQQMIRADYDVTYEVLEDGKTNVHFLGGLYNPSQDYYVSRYTLILNFIDLNKIEARDSSGIVPTEVNEENKQTKIKINFKEKIVGTEKPLKFSLSFVTSSLAQKKGLVWEIVLPKVSEENQLNSLRVTLIVPKSFGPEISIFPKAEYREEKLTNLIYNYSQESLSKTGAILSFGRFQIYRFDLKYTLRNPNLFNAKTKIALPPSIFGEQEVIFDQITPPPANVTTDKDGNSLAEYTLSGGKVQTITVKGRAKIVNIPRNFRNVSTFLEIPKTLVDLYTPAQNYWQTQDGLIKNILKETVGEINSGTSVEEVAKKLYDYSVSTLKYDSNRINPNLVRFGAVKALNNRQSAVCMEFADLYITLLRAAGIPSELLEGYALSESESQRPAIGDILHSWVRFYSPKMGWIQADPTWGNTTGGLDYFSQFDTNHFVFAIKGSSSEFPYPAGAYKISPDQVGDINVSLEKDLTDLPNLEGILSPKTSYRHDFFGQGGKKLILTITNTGKSSLFGLSYKPRAGIFDSKEKIWNIGDLPPFGSIQREFEIFRKPEDFLSLGELTYSNFSGQVFPKEIYFLSGSEDIAKNRFSFPTSAILNVLIILGLCGFLYWLIIFLRYLHK